MGRALLGMIAYHRILRDLLGDIDRLENDSEVSTKIYTEIWLFGTSCLRAPDRQPRSGQALEAVPPPEAFSPRKIS